MRKKSTASAKPATPRRAIPHPAFAAGVTPRPTSAVIRPRASRATTPVIAPQPTPCPSPTSCSKTASLPALTPSSSCNKKPRSASSRPIPPSAPPPRPTPLGSPSARSPSSTTCSSPPAPPPPWGTASSFVSTNADIDATHAATDVRQLLRNNTVYQTLAEEAQPTRKLEKIGARRRRDYLIVVLGANAAATAYITFLAGFGPIQLVSLLGFAVILSVGLYWVMFHIMEPY